MTIVAIRAIVIIVVATVAGLVLMNVFVPGDNTALTVQIVSVVAPTTAALLSLINSAKNSEIIKETKADVQETKAEVVHTAEVAHHAAVQVSANTDKLNTLAGDIDGRLTQLMAESVDKARRLGQKDERDRQEAE